MIVGLTGGIGSGKSLVAQHFRLLGIAVFDADQIARELVEPNTTALEHIATHFGHDILENGHLNRAALRERIFSNEADKHWLEQLLHPLIRQQLLHRSQQANGPYAIIEAPLLFETRLNEVCQYVITVDCEYQQQIERTLQRDQSSREQINAIINSQLSREERLQKADFKLFNTHTESFLIQQIKPLHYQLISLSDTIE